jgi:hypothetical protein
MLQDGGRRDDRDDSCWPSGTLYGSSQTLLQSVSESRRPFLPIAEAVDDVSDRSVCSVRCGGSPWSAFCSNLRENCWGDVARGSTTREVIADIANPIINPRYPFWLCGRIDFWWAAEDIDDLWTTTESRPISDRVYEPRTIANPYSFTLPHRWEARRSPTQLLRAARERCVLQKCIIANNESLSVAVYSVHVMQKCPRASW